MKIKQLLLLVVGVMIVLLTIIYIGRKNTTRDLPEIIEDGRLSVLIESGEHGYTKDSIKVYGFQYEIIKTFSNTMGVELVVLNEDNATDGIAKLMDGQCDVLVSLRPVINDSTIPIRYLSPIISTRLMLVQRKDSIGKKAINKQYELDKDTITLLENSPFIARLNALSEEVAADITLREVKKSSLDDLASMVSDEKLTYTVCPEYLANNLMHRYPTIDISLPLSFQQHFSWSVNKDADVLYEKLNSFLLSFVDTPEFRALYNQYFSDN